MDAFNYAQRPIANDRSTETHRDEDHTMYLHLIRCITITLALGGLTACGGGNGESSGFVEPSSRGDSIVAVGTITGRGSIFVNGVEFTTAGATYRVDDEDRFDDSALAVGMKVRVRGTLGEDGRGGTATRVFYDDDVEGPIDTGSLTAVNASVKTFTVFSLMVRVDAAKTAFSGGAGFDNLAEGQKFEISGYFDSRQIVATRLERQDDLDDEFELRGTVADYDGATISLTLQNGVNAGPFSVTPAAGLLIPDTPAGLLVEAKLRQQSGDLILVGLEAEDEEETADGARMSIRGMLSDDSRDGLLINGVPFFINDQTAYEPASLQAGLMAGLQIKAERYMQGGVLVAQMLVIADGDIRIAARIIEVDQSGGKNGTLTVDAGDARSLVVRTDNSSQFADGSTADLDGDATFDLAELSMVDFVEIRAFQNDAAELVATHIKRQDSGPAIRLEAPLESYTSDVSVTLLGMPFMVGSNTLYELNDVATDALNFFGALNIGDMVRIMGVEPNGTVGKMSLQAVSTGPGAGPVPDTTPDSGPASGLTGINVSFKLDPRLTRTHYLGDRWVSPPLYTRIQEPGRPLTVEVRTQGLAGRTPVAINPEWIAEIPGIISVTPDRGDQVLITVLSVGRTGLNVATQGVSKPLFINVRPHLETMLVEISQ